MAGLKEYRGNPEHKRYATFERFDGGINTAAVDELVYANEFRELINVENAERGLVQNRKGFAEASVLNEVLTGISVFSDYDEFPVVSVISDSYSIIERLYEAESLSSFNNSFENLDYTVSLLVVAYKASPATLKVFRIDFENDEGEILASSTEVYDLSTFDKIWTASDEQDYDSADSEDKIASNVRPIWEENLQWKYPLTMSDEGSEHWEELTVSEKHDLKGYYGLVTESAQGTDTDLTYVEDNYIPATHTPNAEVLEVERLDGEEKTYTYWWSEPLTWDYEIAEASSTTNNDYANITTLPVITHDNHIYFSLHKINKNLEGIFDYDIIEEEGRVISNSENYFVPSPFEVSNVGFNLLADDPFEITSDESTLPQIRNFFLTDYANDSIVLSKIPENERFYLNVIYQGDVPAYELNIEIYEEDAFGEKHVLDSSAEYIEQDSKLAVHKWLIRGNFSNKSYVFVRVYREEESTPNYTQSFDAVGDMVDYFVPSDPEFLVANTDTYYNGYTADTSNYEYEIATVPGRVGWGVPSKSAVDLPLYTKQPFTKYKNTTTQVLIKETSGDSYKVWVCKTDADGYVDTDASGNLIVSFVDEPVGDEVQEFYGIKSSVNSIIPSTSSVYRITDPDPDEYYTLKDLGTYAGTSDDFEEVEPDFETVLSFTNGYSVSSEEKKEPVETISLTNFEMIEYQNRLLIYSGNTMLFSDPYKFNYFPNYNYVVLPLAPDDAIQKISYFRGSHIIFTRESIYRMSGTYGSEDFRILLINDAIGCIAPLSVRSVNNTLIFLSQDGLYTVKQSFFMEGLENVDKVDKQITDLIPRSFNHESLLYNEQYLLFIKDSSNDYSKTLKQYYNQEYSKHRYPYLVDVYEVVPDNLFKLGSRIYSIKDGLFYVYDKGYTDFGETYEYSAMTPNYTLGYPEHDKKFKNIFIKTKSNEKHPIYITVYIDDNEYITPYTYVTTMNEDGFVYTPTLTRSTTTGGTTFVVGGSEDEVTTSEETGVDYESTETTTTLEDDAQFVYGTDHLGGQANIVHKIVVSGKGKSVRLKIQQESSTLFALKSIGILHKLGKAKETR
jgi:hypothetical protein